ncbi:hypothetical protein WJX79_010179 [Trebouxia sp. C0005]
MFEPNTADHGRQARKHGHGDVLPEFGLASTPQQASQASALAASFRSKLPSSRIASAAKNHQAGNWMLNAIKAPQLPDEVRLHSIAWLISEFVEADPALLMPAADLRLVAHQSLSTAGCARCSTATVHSEAPWQGQGQPDVLPELGLATTLQQASQASALAAQFRSWLTSSRIESAAKNHQAGSWMLRNMLLRPTGDTVVASLSRSDRDNLSARLTFGHRSHVAAGATIEKRAATASSHL